MFKTWCFNLGTACDMQRIIRSQEFKGPLKFILSYDPTNHYFMYTGNISSNRKLAGSQVIRNIQTQEACYSRKGMNFENNFVWIGQSMQAPPIYMTFIKVPVNN